eukprot:5036152-Pleurochrysis_carterae.AAC.2
MGLKIALKHIRAWPLCFSRSLLRVCAVAQLRARTSYGASSLWSHLRRACASGAALAMCAACSSVTEPQRPSEASSSARSHGLRRRETTCGSGATKG